VGPSASIGHGPVAPDHLVSTGARSGHAIIKSVVSVRVGPVDTRCRPDRARSLGAGVLDARHHALHRPLCLVGSRGAVHFFQPPGHEFARTFRAKWSTTFSIHELLGVKIICVT
jgi:hypothetical protein